MLPIVGPKRASSLAVLFIALLCGAHTAQAGLLDKMNSWIKRRGEDLAAEATARGVDGLSNFAANLMESEGEPELADAVRSAGDAFESAVRMAIDATACVGFAKTGAAIGGAAGCFLGPLGCAAGAFLGFAFGGLVSPACHSTAKEFSSMVVSSIQSGTALGDALAERETYVAQCGGKSFASEDASDCAIACGEQAPACVELSWYFDRGCCLCKFKPYACTDSSGGEETSGGTPSTSTPSSQRPASNTDADGSCGSIEYDTDYFGADIVPVTTKWADTAVSAASPQDCCEACSLYSYCGAWTFTAAEHCQERFPGAPGCCFLKKGRGYEKRSAPGMVSGTSGGPPVAACTLEFDTDLLGGDIQSRSGPDTVVATMSDADCCQSCAATPGCGAWTMTPPSACSDRLPNARGCCFLKHEGGWTRTKDDKGVLTSGQLV